MSVCHSAEASNTKTFLSHVVYEYCTESKTQKGNIGTEDIDGNFVTMVGFENTNHVSRNTCHTVHCRVISVYPCDVLAE